MNPDLNDIKNKLERIGDKIEDLKDVVNFIKEKMDRSIEIIEKYYNIASDMIKKYEMFNSKLRNYQTLKTIKYLSTSNKEIITDIENIIKGNKVEDWIVKFTKLLEIVEKDRLVYRNKEFELNDNNTNTSNIEPKNNISYKSQYTSKEYPFHCDFYFPNKKLYLEIQGSWVHGKHPFGSCEGDDKLLNQYKKKNSNYYNQVIKIWTQSDPLKRETARKNGLNWVEVFTNDVN